MARFRIRRFLIAGALMGLPLLLLGVAPALQDLIDRMNALEGQVQTLEGESQIVKGQVNTLEAESLALDGRVTLIEGELGGDDLRVFDANGVEIGRLIDASLSGGVTIYLEALAVIARFSTTGNLGMQVTAIQYAQLDCQGPPFLVPGPIVANALQNGIDDLFWVISGGNVVNIPLASVLNSSGCQNRGVPFNIESAVAAELIFDPADLGLTLPLSVPFAIAPAAVGP